MISPENQRSVHDYVSGLLDSQDVPTPEPPVMIDDAVVKETDADAKTDKSPNDDKKATRNHLTLSLDDEANVVKRCGNSNTNANSKRASISPLMPPIYYTTPEETLKNLEKLTEEQNELMLKLESEEDDDKLHWQKVRAGKKEESLSFQTVLLLLG